MCSCSSACFCLCYYDVPPLPSPTQISSFPPPPYFPCPVPRPRYMLVRTPLPYRYLSFPRTPFTHSKCSTLPLLPLLPLNFHGESIVRIQPSIHPSFRVLQPLVPRDVVLVPARVRAAARRAAVEGGSTVLGSSGVGGGDRFVDGDLHRAFGRTLKALRWS